MMRTILIALLLLAASPAAAQYPPGCGPYDHLTKFLTEKHGEAVVGRGVTNRNYMMEFFLSDAGTYTIVITEPTSGVACIRGSGTGWQDVERPKKGDPS